MKRSYHLNDNHENAKWHAPPKMLVFLTSNTSLKVTGCVQIF